MTTQNVYVGTGQVAAFDDASTYPDDGKVVRGIRTPSVRVENAPTATTDVVRLADLDAALIVNKAILIGTLAQRPVASMANAGSLYFATDTPAFYYSNGTAWIAPTIANLSSGTFASRPAFGNTGHFYFSTDKLFFSFDTGLAWVVIGAWLYGLNASIPTPGVQGRFFFAYDQSIAYFDNGSSWQFMTNFLLVPEAGKIGAAGNLGLFQYTIDTRRFLGSDGTNYIPIGTIFSGLTTARPTAGYADRYFFATDTKTLYYDNGAAWVSVSAPVTVVPVADINTCIELELISGSAVGSLILALQTGVGTCRSTLYTWTTATITPNLAFVIAGLSGGWWVGVAGQYVNVNVGASHTVGAPIIEADSFYNLGHASPLPAISDVDTASFAYDANAGVISFMNGDDWQQMGIPRTQPTVSVGAGAGSGGTSTVIGKQRAGVITITTGTSAITGILATLVLPDLGAGYIWAGSLTPNNTAAATAMGAGKVYLGCNQASLTLVCVTGALPDATAHTFAFVAFPVKSASY